MLAVGVKVAVQVVPPSDELTELKVPLAMDKSALVKPVTASLKVIVTRDVSPAARAVSETTKLAVGRSVSIVKLPELVEPTPGVPELLTPVISTTIRLVASSTLALGV